MSAVPSVSVEELAPLQRRALVVGAAALVICAVGAFFSPAQFFRAYLTAYQFFLGIALGSLGILMIYYLTGGAWGFLIRRILEATTRTLPLLAILFVPIACGLPKLYLWAQPEMVAESKNLQHKQLYLNEPFFWVRALLFFLSWSVLAYFLNARSRQQDQTGDPNLARKLTRMSALGLVVYGLTITFASVDWIMSLQPAFRSTIFGPIVASGELLSGHAFALLVLAWLLTRPGMVKLASVEAIGDLGNLLLTFLVIWSYLVWFQFMLIWMANLPNEVIWYLPRTSGGWYWVAWALFVFHFAAPFFLLLMRDIKRDPVALAKVSGMLLFMQLVFGYYQIMPAFPNTNIGDHWMDFLTPFGIGGLWLAYFLRELKRSPLLPLHDANQATALRFHQLDAEAAARETEMSHAR